MVNLKNPFKEFNSEFSVCAEDETLEMTDLWNH